MRGIGTERARDTVRALQERIVSGRWPVNSKIPNEAELAEELGVGRSTIREAVRALAHLGMLEPAPGRGTFVRSRNPVHQVLSDFASEHSWSDILQVRRALETLAAELVARDGSAEDLQRLRSVHDADLAGAGAEVTERGRTPGEFHSLLVEASGNRLLAELYSGLVAALREGRRRGEVVSGQDAEGRHDDHAALLATIAARNPEAAAALAARHAATDLALARE
nr:FCD domain-containing protein [Nocardioides ochotonae]